MRNPPGEYDTPEDLERLQALPWQLALLGLNPEYTGWGPHEDYMAGSAGRTGWNQPLFIDTWKEFAGQWELDDLNEVVNFYFAVERESTPCSCEDGYHPDAKWIADSFYNHSSPFPARVPPDLLAKYGAEFTQFCRDMNAPCRSAWHDRITQDEVQALIGENRLYEFTSKWTETERPIPTAEQVNEWERGRGLGHDGINRSILIRRRCERLGVPLTCPLCDGHGYTFSAPTAHVELVLWFLHPRKGCSRGVQIKRIEQEDLEGVVAYLREAASRNANRFKKIVQIPVAVGE